MREEGSTSMSDRPTTGIEAMPKGRPPITTGKIVGALLATGVVVLFMVGLANSGGSGSDDLEVRQMSAQLVCEDFVKDRLKAPSTADFSNEIVTSAGVNYTVTGSVDAENSFGANLREDYVCKVHYMGNDHWQLVRLSGIR